MSDIRNIIRELARPDADTVALVCTVDAVDKAARTVDCTPLNEGAPILGVNLQANQQAGYGLCIFPEVGSFVVVGFVADGAASVVLATERIEAAEIVIGSNSAVMDADGIRICVGDMSACIGRDAVSFNGGDLGGLVRIRELTDRLNALVNIFNTHTHTGTCPAGAVETVPSVSQATPFTAADYEDKLIKH